MANTYLPTLEDEAGETDEGDEINMENILCDLARKKEQEENISFQKIQTR